MPLTPNALLDVRPLQEDERLMYRTTIEGDYGLGRWEHQREGAEAADAMA